MNKGFTICVTENELKLIYSSCRCLWDSLDVSNGDIKERYPELYKSNVNDMKVLQKIILLIDNELCED